MSFFKSFIGGSTRRSSLLFAASSALLVSLAPSASVADDLSVVTTIRPVHGLVSAVMAGVGEPDLLIEGSASPHDYALRPSDAKALNRADVIFRIGPELEAFLNKPLENLGGKGAIVELLEAQGVSVEAYGEEGHGHADDHDDKHAGHDDKHDDHADKHAGHDDKHDDHADKHAGHDDKHHDHDDKHAHHDDKHADHDDKHDEHKDEHEEHAGHHGHDHHSAEDPHVWLDPANAAAIVREISRVLASKDPARAAQYEKNAAAMITRIEAADDALGHRLEAVAGRPFLVFHDAYGYFVRHYKLAYAGSVTVEPDRPIGAARLAELRHRVEEDGIVCVFAEPQFDSRILSVIAEGNTVGTGVLDPLGSSVPSGPEHYFGLMDALGDALTGCLSS